MSKPHLKQPGELQDMHDVPIYPGDLIRTLHFREGRRRVRRWLYHVAIYDDRSKAMRMLPTSELEPTLANQGGDPLMSQDLLAESEVIAGHGPGKLLSFRDRKRVRVI